MHSDPDIDAQGNASHDTPAVADMPDHPDAPGAIDARIRRSDARQRRDIYLRLGGMALLAVLLFAFGLPWLKRWINTGTIDDVLRKMAWVFDGMGVLMLASAVYAGSFARRIFRSGEFPPPGTWVLRDTPVKHGDTARARAWWVVACAICFVLVAIYMAILPARLHGLVLSQERASPHSRTHR